jgi:hypothetical protein
MKKKDERKIKVPSFYSVEDEGESLSNIFHFLIAELIHRKGRDQQSINASRQRSQNAIRKNEIDGIRSGIKDMVITSKQGLEKLKAIDRIIEYIRNR